MRLKASVFALLVATCYAALAESRNKTRTAVADIRQEQCAVRLSLARMSRIKDNPGGRIEWMREVMGDISSPRRSSWKR